MASDRDDDDTGLVQDLLWRDDDSLEPLRLPHDGRPPGADAWRYVQDLIHVPGISPPDAIPETSDDLRTAGRKKLAAAGFFGEALTPISFEPTPNSASDRHEDGRPRSWKLPARMQPGASIDDNLAASGSSAPQAEAGNADAAATAVAWPGTSTFDNAAGAAARPPTPSPLDHPDARTGLALTAADALLRRGVETVAEMAGGDRLLLRQIVESAVAWLGGVLPPEYIPGAAKSGEAALADANRRIDERDRSTRTRAAIATLANRRVEAEREHTDAVVAGDRGKIAEARREAIEAWSAERRARGDGEAEINAGARELERAYRETALRNRFAKMDEASIKRALDEDDDAKADPATARAVVDDILRIRREDPARAGEASNERKISAKKRDGRIDTPEEEAHERYKLRLEAQAQRGIPEAARRILTNEERMTLALEYHRIEGSKGKAGADRWLDEQALQGGPNAERFKIEVSTPPAPASEAPSVPPRGPNFDESETGRVEPAQSVPDPAKPPNIPNTQTPEQSSVSAARDALRNKVYADADKLDRDYDPHQKAGQPSRIKRAFALLRYVDDPAFDDLAREFLYDPARLRAIARLFAAKPGEYDALMRDLRDENGPIKNSAFLTLYGSHLRGLIGTGAFPDSKALPSEDQRISAVLYLLGHSLTSQVRGDLARKQDVDSAPFPQMLPYALPGLGALGITRKQHGGGKNAPHKSDAQRENWREKWEASKRELEEAHRRQAPREEKARIERQRDHHKRKMDETGEHLGQRQKGPNTRGGKR